MVLAVTALAPATATAHGPQSSCVQRETPFRQLRRCEELHELLEDAEDAGQLENLALVDRARTELQDCMSRLADQLRELEADVKGRLFPAPDAPAEGPDPFATVRQRARNLADDLSIMVLVVESADVDARGEGWDAEIARVRRLFEKLAMDASRLLALYWGETSLTVRGGTSAGNYQAGFTYALTEHLKTQSRILPGAHAPFRTVTGASAGAINSTLATFAGCEVVARPRPDDSVFFKVWIPVGIYGRHGGAGLAHDGWATDSPYALLSQQPLVDATRRLKAWIDAEAHFPPQGCDVDLGLTVTHLERSPYAVHYDVHRGGRETLLSADRQSEAFLFATELSEARGDAELDFRPLRPPVQGRRRAVADTDPERREAYPVLGTGFDDPAEVGRRRYDLADLMQVVLASSAFPGAFAPVELDYSRLNRDERALESYEDQPFIDGGVLDNTPLGLAIEIDSWRDRSRAQPTVVADSALCDLVPPTPRSYVFVEPTVIDWRLGGTRGEDVETPELKGIVGRYVEFSRALFSSALGGKLIDTSTTHPFIRRRHDDRVQPALLVPRRHMPITGERLARFMAFFEQDFRVYDFYVGVADGLRFARRDPVLTQLGIEPDFDDPRLDCVLDFYEAMGSIGRTTSAKELPASCRALEREALAALPSRSGARERLIRRAIKRMDEDWSSLPAAKREPLEAAQAWLAAHNFNALLVAMYNFRGWMESARYAGADDFDRFFVELDRANFRFVDVIRMSSIRVDDVDASDARIAIRDEIDRGLRRLARAQPTRRDAAVIQILGRTAANYYRVRWPGFVIGAGYAWIGGELWAGVAPLYFPIRFDVGGRGYQFRVADTSQDNGDLTRAQRMDLAGFSRLSFGLVQKPAVTWELGLGGTISQSFQFGAGDVTRGPLGDLRFGPEVSTSVVLGQRIYVEGQLAYFVDQLALGRGYGDRPVGEDLRPSLSIGWRWVW